MVPTAVADNLSGLKPKIFKIIPLIRLLYHETKKTAVFRSERKLLVIIPILQLNEQTSWLQTLTYCLYTDTTAKHFIFDREMHKIDRSKYTYTVGHTEAIYRKLAWKLPWNMYKIHCYTQSRVLLGWMGCVERCYGTGGHRGKTNGMTLLWKGQRKILKPSCTRHTTSYLYTSILDFNRIFSQRGPHKYIEIQRI